MTADFKRFRLKPTIEQAKYYSDGTPFIKFLMFKAVQRVSVQIICSRPSETFLEEWSKYYDQMGHPELFSSKFCIRNHCKAVIIDDKIAYVGSANATPAGLGQGIFTPGNFEVGIFTEKKEIISSLKELFSNIMEGEFCSNCHRINRCREKCGPWNGSLIRRE